MKGEGRRARTARRLSGLRRGAGLALLAGAASLAPRDAAASPQDVIGYGARSPAFAGSGVASARGYEAVYANPSLLVHAEHPTLDLGIVGMTFQLSANGPVPSDGLAASLIGGVLPVPLPDPIGDRFVLGFAFLTPFDLVVRSRIQYPEVPQFYLPDAVESVAAMVGLGVDIGWGVHVGGGFEALAALAGSALVAVDSTGHLSAVVQDTLIASYAPIAGASVELPFGLRAGATFRGPLLGKFDVRIDIKDLGQLTVPPIFVSGTAQYDPLTVEAELAEVEGPVHGSVAVGYRRWSDYPGLADPTVRCPLDLETLAIPQCGAIQRVPPGFSDTVIARAAVEWALTPRDGMELDLRAGYGFESAPGPEQTGPANTFAEARSVVGVGSGLVLADPIATGVTLDVFAQLGVLHPRTHEKEASVSADNPGYPRVETSGTTLAAGTAVGVSF